MRKYECYPLDGILFNAEDAIIMMNAGLKFGKSLDNFKHTKAYTKAQGKRGAVRWSILDDRPTPLTAIRRTHFMVDTINITPEQLYQLIPVCKKVHGKFPSAHTQRTWDLFNFMYKL